MKKGEVELLLLEVAHRGRHRQRGTVLQHLENVPGDGNVLEVEQFPEAVDNIDFLRIPVNVGTEGVPDREKVARV